MSTPQSILVTSASGNIGRVLVPLLQSQDPQPELVLPTSNESKLKTTIPSLSSSNSTYIAEGSVKDPVWFQSLLETHSVDTVFLCLTGVDELFTALNCLDALSRVSSVKRLVYLSIIGDFTSQYGLEDTARNRGYPHLFAKVLIEHRLKHADLPYQWTVLGPTLFFSNDLMQKPNLIAKNFFGSPVSTMGVNKVSLSDIALAVRNAMYDTSGIWVSRKVQLGTKERYTGPELLGIWSRALNKRVEGLTSSPEALEDWEQQARQFIPGDYGKAWARSLRILFEFLEDNGIGMSAEEYSDQIALLGKEPDDYETWAKSMARDWSKA